MKNKRSRNAKKIIIFTLILFEFSVVFLFTNVNFENSFSSNFMGNDEYEENPRTSDDVPGSYFHREDPAGFEAFPSSPYIYTILHPGGYTLQESVKDRDILAAGVGNYDTGYFGLRFYGYSNFESTMHDEIRYITIAYRVYFTYNIEIDAENFVFTIYCDDGTSQSITLFDYKSGGYDIPTFEDSITIKETNFGHIFQRVKDGGYIESFSFTATALSSDQFIYVDYFDIYYWYKPEPPILWDYKLSGPGTRSSPAVGDIDDDGILEVVIGSEDGTVYSFNSQNGDLEWSYQTGDIVDSSPSLGDIDKDGKLEVVIGCNDGKVYAFNGEDGSLVWNFTTGGRVGASPTLGDIDNDRELDVIIGSLDGNLYALYGENGSVKWSFQTGGRIRSSAALADIDNDMKLEVIVGSDDNNVYPFIRLTKNI